MKISEIVILILMLVIIAVTGIGMYSQYLDCQDRHGVLVRVMFGYECMAPSK